MFFEKPAGTKWSISDEVRKSGLNSRTAMLDLLIKHFNEAEMIDIAYRLGVNYEDLPGQERKSKILQLLVLCERNARLQELVVMAAKQRPRVDWPVLSNETSTLVDDEDSERYRSLMAQGSSNPSQEVAGLFGIRSNELPGIVLFTLSEDGQGILSGVYLPLDTALFETDVAQIENVIADMFDIIIESRKDAETPLELLENVSLGIDRLRTENSPRPFISFLKQRIHPLSNLPKADRVETIFLTEQFGRFYDIKSAAASG